MSLSRRTFLKGSLSGAGVTALNLTSPLSYAMSSECDSDKPQKALVGINLGGGNDGFHCFVPRSEPFHQQYKALRTTLAYEKDQLIDLDLNGDELNLGLSPELEEIQWLFKKGMAAPVLNVGPLKEIRDEIGDVEQLKPVHIFSHNHQSAVTQTHTGHAISDQGFGGQAAHLLESAFSLSELNPIFEVGSQTIWTNSLPMGANRIGTSMPPAMPLHDLGAPLFDKFRDDSLIANSLFKEYYAEQCFDAQEKFTEFDKILVDEANCPYGFNLNTSLGKQLRTVFLLLLARPQFQHPSQFFSVTLGGFDTHSNQEKDQGELLRLLASQLSVFYHNLENEGLSDSVTTFTFSEFGRTLIPNGSGTDHGWGNCQMVLGGDLLEHKVHGKWPNLAENSEQLLTRGRVIPSLSVDLFHATLLNWLGVRSGDMTMLFPTVKDYHPSMLPMFKSCDSQPSQKLPVAHASASAVNPNGQDKVEYGVDGLLNTKWSAKGRNIDYTIELSTLATVTALRFAQAKGDERQYFMDIEVSEDGQNFQDVTSIDTRGNSDEMVEYPIGSFKAKFVRFVCQGNSDANTSLNQWNNFRHIEVWGQAI